MASFYTSCRLSDVFGCSLYKRLNRIESGKRVTTPSRRVGQYRVLYTVAMVSSDDVQRLFLQAVFSRRVLSADLAKALWKQSVEAVKGTLPHPFRS